MQLQFRKPHISVTKFNPVEIADFSVLTGVNGSGKSHLLQAIDNRSVTISGFENASIVLFNYETFKLDNEPAFNAHQLSAEREQAWQFHQTTIKPQAASWRSQLGGAYPSIRAECEEEKRSLWGYAKEKANSYVQTATQWFNRPDMKQNAHAQGIYTLAKKVPYSVDEFKHEDFVRMYKPYVFKKDFLPNQLGKVFWDYYVKYRGNQVNNYENEKNGKNYAALTEAEFIDAHGDKPWDIVNKILQSFDSLYYEVTSPEGSDYFGSYQLRLRHTEKPNLEIDFDALSSGERILMALVASVYKSSSDNHFPDVLLLDEVDASLHPSMMKNMLQVIERIFLKQGVKVILVTHSPTTIALAPEDSIFVMNRDGTNRIEKKSRSDALQILTQGFATIEQGLKLFDQVAMQKTTIVTEGHNAAILRKALDIFGISGVGVLSGVEHITGSKQLRTLFEFFYRVEHSNSVIFVWDCDAKGTASGLPCGNKTFPIALENNPDNTFVTRGIENAFPQAMCEKFTKKTFDYQGKLVSASFDDQSKKDFATHVIQHGTVADFSHFSTLVARIKEISTQQ
ncbi:MAG: AAA family ATPase [Burkholderiaceae bacterium]